MAAGADPCATTGSTWRTRTMWEVAASTDMRQALATTPETTRYLEDVYDVLC